MIVEANDEAVAMEAIDCSVREGGDGWSHRVQVIRFTGVDPEQFNGRARVVV